MTDFLLPDFRGWLHSIGKSRTTSKLYADKLRALFRDLGCPAADWVETTRRLQQGDKVIDHLDRYTEAHRAVCVSAWTQYAAFLALRGVVLPSVKKQGSPKRQTLRTAGLYEWLTSQGVQPVTASNYRRRVEVLLEALKVETLDVEDAQLEADLNCPAVIGDVLVTMPETSARHTVPAWNAFLRYLRETRSLDLPDVSLATHPKLGNVSVAVVPPEAKVDALPPALVSALWDLLRNRPDIDPPTLRALRWDYAWSDPPGVHPAKGMWRFRSPVDLVGEITFPFVCRRALGVLWDLSGGQGTVVPPHVSLEQIRSIVGAGKRGMIDLLPLPPYEAPSLPPAPPLPTSPLPVKPSDMLLPLDEDE